MKLLLLFTYGNSLKIWDKLGLFDREIALYNRLSKEGISIKFLTYGLTDIEFKEKYYRRVFFNKIFFYFKSKIPILYSSFHHSFEFSWIYDKNLFLHLLN